MDRKLFYDNHCYNPKFVMSEFIISGVDCILNMYCNISTLNVYSTFP